MKPFSVSISWTKCAAFLAVFVSAFVFSMQDALSAASWSDQPTWAQGGSGNDRADNTSRRPAYNKDSHFNLSPFAPGTNNLAIDVGQVFLMGDLGNNYADTIGSQLHYTYGVSDIFGFDASAGYSDHSDGKYSMSTLLAGLRTNLAWYDKVIPYFTFGLGFYKPSIELTPANSISTIQFGIHMGPGVDLELTRQLFFGAGLVFHDMFGTTKLLASGEKIDFGGSFTSFFLRAGVSF